MSRTPPPSIELRFTGDYSLAASVELTAGASFVPHSGDGGLDLAFSLDGTWASVAVRVSEDAGGVRARVLANPDRAATDDIRSQLERILCLDTDGVGFREVAARDAVVARLSRRRPGVRPVLFPSPYEAAARAIIGHRLYVKQAAAVTTRVAAEHGARLDAGDRVMHAFPAPGRLAELPPVQGLSERKVEQLRALGAAAGRLGTRRLRAMGCPEALADLQKLAGIGPFSAELILIRGVGDPDAFPQTELRLHKAMATAYGFGDAPTPDALERVAERWRPYRSWVGLLLRNAAPDDLGGVNG